MRRLKSEHLLGLLALAAAPPAVHPYGAELQGFRYPFPAHHFSFTAQRQKLRMAYLDVRPAQPNGRVVVLLHGKNFCAATWEAQIRALTAAGYRVIAPDQIGFCASSKPAAYQFSFPSLAANTHALLASLRIDRAIVIGHSMGGMLAIRYALMFPKEVERLVLVDPLGLEDWQAKGVPYQPLDAAYAKELRTSFASLKAYQLKYYYAGAWRPDYDRWVNMEAGLFAGAGRSAVAWNAAQTSEMIYTEPVVYELGRLAMPVTLMIGDKDRTAPGADRATPQIAAALGDYPALARQALARIPHATLIEFPGSGHAPQISEPDAFDARLLSALRE